MMDDFASLVRLGPAVWPGAELDVQPSDLSQFAPSGMGLSSPLMMMPWDTFDTACERTSYYDLDRPAADPIKAAPAAEPAGGAIYFAPPNQDDFQALVRLLQIRCQLVDYAVFVEHSTDTSVDRYLTQLRIISTSALANLYRAPIGDADETFLNQPLPVGELLWKFITHQQEVWGTGYSNELAGTLGGDNDWAREKLAFGLLIENAYHCVYRIWSRPWLVTK